MNYKNILKIISLNVIFFYLLLFFFEFLFTTYKATKFYQEKLIKNNRNLFHDLKSVRTTKDAVVPIYPHFLLRNNMFSEIKKMSGEDEGIFPSSGISNKLTLFCQESDFMAEYTSDRFGFNNDDRLYDHRETDFLFI
jgi:hypothetical protein